MPYNSELHDLIKETVEEYYASYDYINGFTEDFTKEKQRTREEEQEDERTL